uniref:Myosin heavy chain 15 n=1 Tax=Chinchilla lanigera TaxID=34839 RepID=A0A8C2VCK6_CHILA
MDLSELGEAAAFLRRSDTDLLLIPATAFDGKEKCWVCDGKNAYIEAEVKGSEADGNILVETKDGRVRDVKQDSIQQMNSEKSDMIEDVAKLTHLNEASVLHTLRRRYEHWVIHTYSGLSCVTLNPYKWLPVYQKEVMAAYRGKRRSAAPPHIFAVADHAFQVMLHSRENQSILFTGESGSGKTVNTKHILQYFATVAAMTESRKKLGTLEDQIVQVNPILEAFGNAKTLRNDNSSRFGKFIRMYFDSRGLLSSADIEIYLFEKSRVIYQLPGERNYHIFYQILSGKKELHDMLLASANPCDFRVCSCGVVAVDSLDDAEELLATEQAMDILGFLPEEKQACFKLIGAIMHFGNIKFKQKPREEKLEADGMESADKAASLMGINSSELVKGLIHPKMKIGHEYVTKSQNVDQATCAVGALSKSIYGRMFEWLVARINRALDAKLARQFFIGILDITGFEILECNSLEQLCINFTNEKLQQFFNQHMFILEQEEYRKEGIGWVPIDFALDLQGCIDLIEKPMGLLCILEEECMFPKATDMTFKTKLFDNHFGKSVYFQKPKLDKKEKYEVHFELVHYAGVVIFLVLSNFLKYLLLLFKALQFGEKKQKKGSSFQLVASLHKENLNKLMSKLKSTAPHFVRCIKPNVSKIPGIIDPAFVLQQLRYNGVLEGIRISREGFPNRMLYGDFKQRFRILNPRIFSESEVVSHKKATEELLGSLEVDRGQYQLGVTKVFLRASFLSQLEEKRDERLSRVFTLLQARAQGKLMRIKFQKVLKERDAILLIQWNIRAHMAAKNWTWMRLFFKVKPLIKSVGAGKEMARLKEESAQLREALARSESEREDLRAEQVSLSQDRSSLLLQLQAEQENLANVEEQCESLIKSKIQLEARVKELSKRVEEEEEINAELTARGRNLEDECFELKKEIDDLETMLAKSEKEKHAMEHKVKNLTEEVDSLKEDISKLNRATKDVQEAYQQTQDYLNTEQERLSDLSVANLKLRQQVDELEGTLEWERKVRMNWEREKHKLKGDLKVTQENVENLEQSQWRLAEQLRKKELEMSQMNSKVENDKGLVAQLQKTIKELQNQIRNLKEELEDEKASRARVEREREDLAHDLEDLNERLREAGGASLAQLEITKNQETRFQKLHQDMEKVTQHYEAMSASLKKRHADSLAEIEAQMENLQQAKQKLEKEKSDLQLEVDDLLSRCEQMTRAKVNAEKLCSLYEARLSEGNIKLDEVTQLANDLKAQKTKLQNDSGESLKKLEEKEALLNQLSREKGHLTRQIEELRGHLEEKTRSQSALTHALQSAKHDLDLLREQYEEEQEVKAELHRALSKGSAEMVQLRMKYEQEAIQRTEDLEEAKKKLAVRLQEAAEATQVANARSASLERARHQLQLELGDALSDLGKARSAAAALDQKLRHSDEALAQWRRKHEEAQALLDASQKEARALSAEVLELRRGCEESAEGRETLRRENDSLREQISSLTDKVREGTRNLTEMERVKKLVEQEKTKAQLTLEETEGALERNESKILRIQLELTEARTELERKLSEKEEEMENFRKQQCAIDALQSSLDSEARSRIEATQLKKKMEGGLRDAELQLCSAHRQASEATKALGQLQSEVKDLQRQLDDSTHLNSDLKEQVASAERRTSLLQSELEELRSMQEQTESARKLAEKELLEATDKINLFHIQNTSLLSQKKKLEADVAQMQKAAEEMVQARENAEENSKKAATEAANLSEELKKEQNTNAHLERMRKNMEHTITDLQKRLDEAGQTALMGNKKQIQKLESRVRELEGELDREVRRSAEAQKEARRLERGIKELTAQAEEDKKSVSRMQMMIDKLQLKVQSYKHQVEAAEAQANQYLSKYKKQQHELNEVKERAETAESQLNKLRVKGKEFGRKVRQAFNSVVIFTAC